MDALWICVVVGSCEKLMASKIYVIDVLLLPKEHRSKGRGSQILTKLCGWADVEETMLVLSADSTVCGRVGSEEEDGRLVAFYERFGFRPSDIRTIYTDTILTSKNIMERPPEPVLSERIVMLSKMIRRISC